MQTEIKHLCPNCRSVETSLSHRRGPVEKYFFRVIRVRPYRCLKCDSRFYGFSRAEAQAKHQAA
jgi:transcriptional regulator NrdR family protein